MPCARGEDAAGKCGPKTSLNMRLSWLIAVRKKNPSARTGGFARMCLAVRGEERRSSNRRLASVGEQLCVENMGWQYR